MLKDDDESAQFSHDPKKEQMMNYLLRQEEENSRLEDKCKEQIRINQELADKIQ